MTRETKIGLLTGLGVIVLIGVLLSQYLGGPAASTTANLSSLGTSYRQRQLQPDAVQPAVEPAGTMLAGVDTPAGGLVSTVSVSGVDPQLAHLPTGAVAAAPAGAGSAAMPPVIADPVTPQPAGSVNPGSSEDIPAMPPIQIGASGSRGSLEHANYVAADPSAAHATATSNDVPAGTFYTVAKGDTLTSISKHFYKAASSANFSKIITANPTLLKDQKTTLRVGEKLLLPDGPKPVAASVTVAPEPSAPAPSDTLVLRPDTGSPAQPATVTPGAPHPAAVAPAVKTKTTYTVQAGDTLAKIARKFLGSSSNQSIKKIAAANKIQDPNSLQIGMTLHIPAKSAS